MPHGIVIVSCIVNSQCLDTKGHPNLWAVSMELTKEVSIRIQIDAGILCFDHEVHLVCEPACAQRYDVLPHTAVRRQILAQEEDW